jgi:hypothetical protein
MLIYHGSPVIVEHPRIIHPPEAKDTKDFGPAFYCTMFENQAVRWATRKSCKGFVNTYMFNESCIQSLGLNVCKLELGCNWLNFVSTCRANININHGYDIVIGPLADDDVYRTLRDYFHGEFDSIECIRRLKSRGITNQIAFCSERSLLTLRYLHNRRVSL